MNALWGSWPEELKLTNRICQKAILTLQAQLLLKSVLSSNVLSSQNRKYIQNVMYIINCSIFLIIIYWIFNVTPHLGIILILFLVFRIMFILFRLRMLNRLRLFLIVLFVIRVAPKKIWNDSEEWRKTLPIYLARRSISFMSSIEETSSSSSLSNSLMTG